MKRKSTEVEAILDQLNLRLSKIDADERLLDSLNQVALHVVNRRRKDGRRATDDISPEEKTGAYILDEVFQQGVLAGVRVVTAEMASAIEKGRLKDGQEEDQQ